MEYDEPFVVLEIPDEVRIVAICTITWEIPSGGTEPIWIPSPKPELMVERYIGRDAMRRDQWELIDTEMDPKSDAIRSLARAIWDLSPFAADIADERNSRLMKYEQELAESDEDDEEPTESLGDA